MRDSAHGVFQRGSFENVVLVALLAIVAVVAVATITPWPVGAFQDDAIYTVLAKSLAEGNGFRFINLPGEPNATHFPPGYPVFLAVLWKVWPDFPDNIVIFKFANAAFLGVAACGSYKFSRQNFGTPIWLSVVVAVVGTLSIVVLLVTGVVMSEPMFLALLFPTLLAGERAARDGRASQAAIAGAMCGTLGLVRTIGAAALPALLVTLLWRRRWRSAIAAAAAGALFLLPWQIWVGLHASEVASSLSGKYGSYSGWALEGYRDGGIEFAIAVFKKNLRDIAGMLGAYFVPVSRTAPQLLGAAVFASVAFYGTKRYHRNAPVSLLFLGLYMLIVMFWPFEPARFLLAVWPLLPLLVGCGAVALWNVNLEKGPQLAWRSVLAGALLVLIGGSAYYNYYGFRNRWWAAVQRDAGIRAKPTVEWAARYTKRSDILSTEDDLIVYLYTDRKALPTTPYHSIEYTRPVNDDQMMKGVLGLFDDYDPDWYIVGSAKGVQTADALALQPYSMLRYTGRTQYVAMYQRVNK